jgi:glycosyltransferase involved in cell wall biosynthesis
MNVAIICPQKDAISETFIKAHRELIKGNIYFLYGGFIPTHSEEGKIGKKNLISPIWKRILPLFIYQRIKSNPAKELAVFFRNKNIEIVLAEYGQTGCGVLPICKKLSVPMIVHFHGADASKKSVLDLYEDRYKELFDYASFIIGVSRKMINRLLQLGAPSSKLVYAVYGPNERFFQMTPDYKHGYFLSVGRFVEKKAPFLTLLAFKQLQDKHPEARLIMVGEGPLLPVCKSIASSLNLKSVEFTGALPHEEIINLFNGACCFVQHSMVAEDGDAEGTPVAVLEAGAAGLPVVSTFHEGIPDVIVHDKTGFLVTEGDINLMAKYLENIFTNESLRIEMGMNARKHIAENFTMQQHIGIIDDLIERSIRNKSSKTENAILSGSSFVYNS